MTIYYTIYIYFSIYSRGDVDAVVAVSCVVIVLSLCIRTRLGCCAVNTVGGRTKPVPVPVVVFVATCFGGC